MRFWHKVIENGDLLLTKDETGTGEKHWVHSTIACIRCALEAIVLSGEMQHDLEAAILA